MAVDLVQNRLQIVPAIGVYETESTGYTCGAIGVRVSNITGVPAERADESFLGKWRGLDAELTIMSGPHDTGPRSGFDARYRHKIAARGKVGLALTDKRLLGAFEGRTAWGHSGPGNIGRIVVFSWNLRDIDNIVVSKEKKYFKLWDEQLILVCDEPFARLDLGILDSRSTAAKALRFERSDMSGFARAVGRVAANQRGTSYSINDRPFRYGGGLERALRRSGGRIERVVIERSA
jgi:hypothetical protein